MIGYGDTLDLHDLIGELTRAHTHRETYETQHAGTRFTGAHVTQVPPLLAQLSYATPSGAGEERGNLGFESRPAARLEALDTLMRIDDAAARLVRQLGGDDPGDLILNQATGVTAAASGAMACIRKLGALAGHPCGDRPKAGCCRHHHVEREVRRWWTWARVATGWDSPPWCPDSTCPACGERGTLRINLVGEVGTCVDDRCRETWDSFTLGLLAEHIRVESAEERRRPVSSSVCSCRLPRVEQGRWGLCPRCGSAYCVGAEEVADAEAKRRQLAAEERRLEELQRRVAAHLAARGVASIGAAAGRRGAARGRRRGA